MLNILIHMKFIRIIKNMIDILIKSASLTVLIFIIVLLCLIALYFIGRKYKFVKKLIYFLFYYIIPIFSSIFIIIVMALTLNISSSPYSNKYIRNETKSSYTYVRDDKGDLKDDRGNIHIDNRILRFLRENKLKSKREMLTKLSYIGNNAQSQFSNMWTSNLAYFLKHSHSRFKSIMSSYKRDKKREVSEKKHDTNFYKGDKYYYSATWLKDYIGFHNFSIFGYLFLYLILFSFLYIIYNIYVLINVEPFFSYNDIFLEFKNSFKYCISNVMEKYVFHLIPLIIAILGGLLALFVNKTEGNIEDNGGNIYLFLIRGAIPILSSIQFLRISFCDLRINKILNYFISYIYLKIKSWLYKKLIQH